MWSRIANALRAGPSHREIDEELASHLAEAIESGRDPAEARQAFGPVLRTGARNLPRLPRPGVARIAACRHGVRRSAVAETQSHLGCRGALAGLAIGACTAAFRLIDALLWRGMPVSHPEELYAFSREATNFDGAKGTYDSFAYPDFLLMRAAAQPRAELFAASTLERTDLTYRTPQEMEKAHLQYVSGSMFSGFGLRPAAGRLLTADDDLKPGAHPYAVLSRDYWQRRFAGDPGVVGRTFHLLARPNASPPPKCRR